VNHLSDTQLNKLLDDEVEISAISKINEHLEVCELCRNKLKSLKTIHGSLYTLKEEETPLNFTFLLMRRVEKSLKRKQEQKYFYSTIVASFFIIILGIIGYIVSTSSFVASSTVDLSKYLGSFEGNYNEALKWVNKYFGMQSLTLIGSILSMGVILTAFYFYDSLKTMKNFFKK
jgi:hypothetical protein